MGNHEMTVDAVNLYDQESSVSVRPHSHNNRAVVELNTTNHGNYATFYLELDDAEKLARLLFGALLRARRGQEMSASVDPSERLAPL